MRLAAIYIEDHEYIFKEPQTINFGGQYLYEFKNVDNSIFVKRIPNEKFISGFFDLTHLQSKVTNLNVIVGQNGSGKSTLLDVIRGVFIDHGYELSRSNCLLLVEKDDSKDPVIIRNDFDKIFIENQNKRKLLKVSRARSNERLQTIYYSPHFDYKYNPNFSNIDNHDISFDKILENDLDILNSDNVSVNGSSFSASQELLFANSVRQIFFLSSELASRSEVFRGLFNFQKHYSPILYFRVLSKEVSFWNTPRSFRPILKIIKAKIEEEQNQWSQEGSDVKGQIQVYQYILKRRIIEGVLSVLIDQMERQNTFLEEGVFDLEKYKERINVSTAYDTLLLFIEQAYIEGMHLEKFQIINKKLFYDLINKVYTVIDKIDSIDDITNATIKVSVDDALEVLRLQRQFLIELSSYYTKFYTDKSDLTGNYKLHINEFISYMPFSRRMSSGESALLNFYSRMYAFLSDLKELGQRRSSIHYILLLDEADLTFHITWKKRYVKALLSALPYFFEELEYKPTFEIIFTTHDPITLSDVPNTNVIYIERPENSSFSNILNFTNQRRPIKTFGANISDLIADSFFTEKSLIGDFAFDKIQEAIKWLTDENRIEGKSYIKKLINIIDEPIIQRKLAEMYDDKTKESFQVFVIDEQIEKLQELRKRFDK